ncbi:aldo/keto reductase [Streptomyces cyaneogriseus subsp. noncyanogenus]|uniref:Aldo/keto reductase n=1 Tax=Streptomyces cyaneogriseus subsp. noncyanogenus TaxID=477245 RepID=A0A0C5G0I3_9ACTN|nr:aldo/keto reductase [Streptomyces cyaneogriseus]AJP02035.1 aldo/keto reductase [Streptomyces cyaneogriseus subsp. noncyanogenus]
MRTTTLGKNGPVVGRVGLGTMGMSFGYDPHGWDDDASVQVIHRALDLGVNLIDTADVYGPFTNETLVGRALKGRRDEVVLSTKGGLVVGEDGLGLDGRPEHLTAAVDASLQRLGVDHIDLYFLHRVDPNVPLEESWGALAEQVEAGKIRALGLSAVTLEQIRAAQAVHEVAAVESEASLFTRDAFAEVLPYTVEQGIAFLPFSPLGRGLLTGAFTKPADLPKDDWRSTQPRFTEEAFAHNKAIVDAVAAVAARHGATTAQVALAWLIGKGEYVVPIPGTKTARYLEQNAGGADLELTAQDVAELDALPEPMGAPEA